MFWSVGVSAAFHLILLSLLAITVVRSPERRRSHITTLMMDAEADEVEISDTLREFTPIDVATVQEDAGADGGAADTWVPNPVLPGRLLGPILRTSGTGTGGNEGVGGRFSPTLAQRRERYPAAKEGDYEIVLVWDGPSDLDLTVDFPPNTVRGGHLLHLLLLGGKVQF